MATCWKSMGFPSAFRRASVTVSPRNCVAHRSCIAANIVEGFRKRGRADELRFFKIAQGSADECVYYLILVRDLKYADTADLQKRLEEVCRLLQAYMNAIEK